MKTNRELLSAVYSKTDGRCWYCAIPIDPFGTWQIEHQIPKTQQGSDDLANLVPACRRCNCRKGPRNIEEFRSHLRARLVNKISDAEEFVYEFAESLPTLEQSCLDEISSLIAQAATRAASLEIEFYAERVAALQAEPLTAVQSETEAVS